MISASHKSAGSIKDAKQIKILVLRLESKNIYVPNMNPFNVYRA